MLLDTLQIVLSDKHDSYNINAKEILSLVEEKVLNTLSILDYLNIIDYYFYYFINP